MTQDELKAIRQWLDTTESHRGLNKTVANDLLDHIAELEAEVTELTDDRNGHSEERQRLYEANLELENEILSFRAANTPGVMCKADYDQVKAALQAQPNNGRG